MQAVSGLVTRPVILIEFQIHWWAVPFLRLGLVIFTYPLTELLLVCFRYTVGCSAHVFRPGHLQLSNHSVVMIVFQIHWWAVLLMCIGLVIFMALFIKFCAVHTPSSNPNKPPARKLTQTLNTLRRHRRPQQPYQPTRSAVSMMGRWCGVRTVNLINSVI